MAERKPARLKLDRPLATRMQEHFLEAVGGIENLKLRRQIERSSKKVFPKVPQIHLVNLFNKEFAIKSRVSEHIGQPDVRRNGLTFTVEGRNNKNLVRLYLPAGLSENNAKELIAKMYSPRILEKLRAPRNEQNLLTEAPNDNTFYFASAEIMVRTLAHIHSPKNNPLPIALVNSQNEPVGFIMPFKNSPVSAEDLKIEVTDTFFDWWMFDSYGPSKDLSKDVLSAYRTLKKVNVVPYNEEGKDLVNLLLFDKGGNFVTFSRLGYVIS